MFEFKATVQWPMSKMHPFVNPYSFRKGWWLPPCNLNIDNLKVVLIFIYNCIGKSFCYPYIPKSLRPVKVKLLWRHKILRVWKLPILRKIGEHSKIWYKSYKYPNFTRCFLKTNGNDKSNISCKFSFIACRYSSKWQLKFWRVSNHPLKPNLYNFPYPHL